MLTGINKIVDLKVKPYAHKNCGKAFSCSCDRNRSETLHTSQQPNVCNHCQKAFTRLTQYKSITIPLDRNLLYINMVYKLFLCSCHFNKHKISHSVCIVGKSSAYPVSITLMHRSILERIVMNLYIYVLFQVFRSFCCHDVLKNSLWGRKEFTLETDFTCMTM